MSTITVHEHPTIYAASKGMSSGVYPCEIVSENPKSYRVKLCTKNPFQLEFQRNRFMLSKAELATGDPIVRKWVMVHKPRRTSRRRAPDHRYTLEFFTDRTTAEAALIIGRDVASELRTIRWHLEKTRTVMEAITAVGGTLPPELDQVLALLQHPESKVEIEVGQKRPALERDEANNR